MGDIKKNRKRARPSGRFLLRLPPGLHALLRRAAAEAGISLNDYCVRKLSAPVGGLAAFQGASDVVARAAERFGANLVGVAAFGSWARRQATAGSDVDILVVIENAVPLTRELYRSWDDPPISWGGLRIEAHFAHLPEPGRVVAGVWAEVAIDGVVLFERDLRVSTRLSEVRRDIAAGRIVRKLVHGQPYWALVA